MAAGVAAVGITLGNLTGNRSIDVVEVDEDNPQQIVVYENRTPRR